MNKVCIEERPTDPDPILRAQRIMVVLYIKLEIPEIKV